MQCERSPRVVSHIFLDRFQIPDIFLHANYSRLDIEELDYPYTWFLRYLDLFWISRRKRTVKLFCKRYVDAIMNGHAIFSSILLSLVQKRLWFLEDLDVCINEAEQNLKGLFSLFFVNGSPSNRCQNGVAWLCYDELCCAHSLDQKLPNILLVVVFFF